jgi:signal peptidase I
MTETTAGSTSDSAAPDLRRPAPSQRRGWVTFLRDVLIIVLVAVLVSFLVKTFLVRSFYIPSQSMEATLLVQDRILVDEITPRFGDYARGDVVVFRDPGGWLPVSPPDTRSPLVQGIDWTLALVGLSAPDSDDHLIKRVIGLPGDHVVCCDPIGQITVNGVSIDETSYVQLQTGESVPDTFEFDVTVPADSLWVLGDNRDRSKDSRYNQEQPGKGFVPVENVVGRAFVITWPFNRFGLIDFHHDVFAGVPVPPPAGSAP